MRVVIATRFVTGLGFAMRLQQAGHEVVMADAGINDRRAQPRYDSVGDGTVRKLPLATLMQARFVDGEPRFAFVALDSKFKLTGDLGDLIRCAFDFVCTIPVDSRAVAESVGRLFRAYRERRYTGFADANFIAARDRVWFFEKCEHRVLRARDQHLAARAA